MIVESVRFWLLKMQISERRIYFAKFDNNFLLSFCFSDYLVFSVRLKCKLCITKNFFRFSERNFFGDIALWALTREIDRNQNRLHLPPCCVYGVVVAAVVVCCLPCWLMSNHRFTKLEQLRSCLGHSIIMYFCYSLCQLSCK